MSETPQLDYPFSESKVLLEGKDLDLHVTTDIIIVKRLVCGALLSTVKNVRHNRADLSFFRFPTDEDRCKWWVLNCGRAVL